MAGRVKIEWTDDRADEEIDADKWTDEGLWIDFHLAYRRQGSAQWDWEQVLRVRADTVKRVDRVHTSDRSAAS